MNVLQAIGNTPLVELVNLNPNPKVKVLCKLEGCNPGGSVKDRPALYMITKAEQSGELTKDKTILEPTSGNTGIAIAMIGAAKGYHVELCMPECVSTERRLILEGLGSHVFLTPARENIDGAIRQAHALIEANPGKYFMANQYENHANVLSHVETTGPEIYRQTEGEVDYFVAGMGTTGTLMGVGAYLKSVKPSVQIVGVEPVMGHTIQGLKNMTESMVPGIYRRRPARSQGDGRRRRGLRDDPAPRHQGGPLRGHLRGCGDRGGAPPGQDDRPRHDRGDSSRSRGPVPQHYAVQVDLRKMSAVRDVGA